MSIFSEHTYTKPGLSHSGWWSAVCAAQIWNNLGARLAVWKITGIWEHVNSDYLKISCIYIVPFSLQAFPWVLFHFLPFTWRRKLHSLHLLHMVRIIYPENEQNCLMGYLGMKKRNLRCSIVCLMVLCSSLILIQKYMIPLVLSRINRSFKLELSRLACITHP